MKRLLTLLILSVAFVSPLAAAQQAAGNNAAQQPAGNAALTDGEVRRIDKDAKKLTLRHGPITNLDMPAMTMVFQVKDAALLDKVNVGDKVKFAAEKIPGGYAVTRIEAAK